MDGLGGHYAKWTKSDKNTVWCHLYVESKKYNKLVNITKKTTTIENKLVATTGEGDTGEDSIGVGN